MTTGDSKMKKEPRIKQIIPVNDVWEKHTEEDGAIYFNKVVAMALVEFDDFDAIHYLFRNDLESIADLNELQNPEKFFFTHEIDPDLLKLSYNKP